MSFDTHGFFSPEIDRFRATVRSLPECKIWFEFAEDLNRLGLEMLSGHETPLDDRQRFPISVLFIRAHQSFQAAVILAERGMIGDARTLLRGAVEGAIASNALAADPKFVEQLIAAHRKHQLTIARVMLETPDYRATCSSEDVAKMEATVVSIEALRGQPDKEPKNINWADVAEKHCKDLYHTLYRLLSADGVHTTVYALDRHIEVDATTRITSLKTGPDIAGLVDTLRAACLTFLWAAEPFSRAFERPAITAKIQEQLQRFDRLPRDEPNG